MTKKRWRNKARPERREGRHVPVTKWKCFCGRRYRGDAQIWNHLDRSRHGVAFSVTPQWKSSHT